jgi:hypothetical protein
MNKGEYLQTPERGYCCGRTGAREKGEAKAGFCLLEGTGSAGCQPAAITTHLSGHCLLVRGLEQKRSYSLAAVVWTGNTKTLHDDHDDHEHDDDGKLQSHSLSLYELTGLFIPHVGKAIFSGDFLLPVYF